MGSENRPYLGTHYLMDTVSYFNNIEIRNSYLTLCCTLLLSWGYTRRLKPTELILLKWKPEERTYLTNHFLNGVNVFRNITRARHVRYNKVN
jgi:hypothetical protein